jgi:hypothetical protein
MYSLPSNAVRAATRLAIIGLLWLWCPQPASAQGPNGWTVAIHPVIGWLPLFGASVDLPSLPEIPGDSGASATIDTSWDQAYLAGFALQSRHFVAEGEFLWAGLSGTLEAPRVALSSDIIYGEAYAGPRFGDFAIVGGVRRLAVKVVAEFAQRPTFERKPGVWDPLVGVDYRRTLGRRWNLQITALGGGFGVGTDVDLSGRVKADWTFVPHVGVSLGYQVLYFKLSDDLLGRTFKTSQTLHGPIAGVGIYF